MGKSKLVFALFFCVVPILTINAAEYRLGLSMHDVERRIEGGAALSIEKILIVLIGGILMQEDLI